MPVAWVGDVWKGCPTCQGILKSTDEDEVCQCDNCGHLFHCDEVVWVPNPDNVSERCLCVDCFGNDPISEKKCCASCTFCAEEEIRGTWLCDGKKRIRKLFVVHRPTCPDWCSRADEVKAAERKHTNIWTKDEILETQIDQ